MLTADKYESNMLVSSIQHLHGFDMRREVVSIAASRRTRCSVEIRPDSAGDRESSSLKS
jgi:hypothetical protein